MEPTVIAEQLVGQVRGSVRRGVIDDQYVRVGCCGHHLPDNLGQVLALVESRNDYNRAGRWRRHSILLYPGDLRLPPSALYAGHLTTRCIKAYYTQARPAIRRWPNCWVRPFGGTPLRLKVIVALVLAVVGVWACLSAANNVGGLQLQQGGPAPDVAIH